MANVTEIAKLGERSRSKATNARIRADKRLTARALFSSEIDGRTSWGRAFRDRVGLIIEDAGGLANVSEVKLSLIRRFVALSIESERMEILLARGKKVDLDLLQRLLGQLRRVAEMIGVDKVTRERTLAQKLGLEERR